MSSVSIYTIGYGKRSIKEFVALLRHYEIQFLVDVRSHPYSRHNSQFSKEALERYLKLYGIRYIFMGDTLGGRPNDTTCYLDGRVDYAKVNEKPFYQQGIKRLCTAWEKQLSIVVMCAEAKPQECHRSKLIGSTLVVQNIDVVHIDETGGKRTQEEIIQMLINDQPQFSQKTLFDVPSATLVGYSRKKYFLVDDKGKHL